MSMGPQRRTRAKQATIANGTQQSIYVRQADQRAMLRRRHLGFVFQGFNLLSRTTALENVELPLIYRGDDTATRRKASMAALDKVGLADWADHTPSELSGGQQQRVAIDRRRHRHHEHHAGLGHRTDPRDRHPPRGRRGAA